MSRELVPGVWRTDEYQIDYRIERLSDMLIERATWRRDVAVRRIGDTVIVAPGYIWFRFWLLRDERLVEKYFRDDGEGVGIYVPLCMPFFDSEHGLKTSDLVLALWLASDGQVTVLHEAEFENGIANGLISSAEASEAEDRIRAMTLETAQGLFPPAIIRNFELNLGSQA
jgi:predicted RNA-binding protein associated with RNAse of E/G family